MPVFSIIIPLYNKEKYIQNTIESALHQTFTDFEIIVVNDGSTDSSLAIVEQIEDSRIKIFSTKNGGVSKARNYGIEKAQSDLIAFLDADDLWEENHLESLYKLWKKYPNCGLYASGYSKKFDNSRPIKAVFAGLENFFGVVEDFFKSSTVDCVAWTSAIMIPAYIFKKTGYFNDSLKSGQDTDLWIRIALKEKVAFNSKITALKVTYRKENHLSNSKFVIDRLKIFEYFKQDENKNSSLKKYLDLSRFSMAIDRKINDDNKNYKHLLCEIEKKNLNFKQRLLIKLPKRLLITIKEIQFWLIKRNIYLTSFN
ncbi:glycosyltransferase [Flavobacteriaceae bacterium]|nr:glycosyltransferase [Flavobacteriaceae bacterium]